PTGSLRSDRASSWLAISEEALLHDIDASPRVRGDAEPAMTVLTVRIGPMSFAATLESERAPRTSEAFRARLPFEGRLVQARWSGEAGWVPLGDYDLGVAYENATSHPAPGQVLWHPPGLSEAELL